MTTTSPPNLTPHIPQTLPEVGGRALPQNVTAKDVARFWAKVDSAGECWEWTGERSGRGYGRFWIHGRRPTAHRVSWEMAYGPIPAGLLACHRCDNRVCVRPDHLFLGTHADNQEDRRSKEQGREIDRRQHIRLTADDIRAIRALSDARLLSREEIGKQYGVSRQHISFIVARRRWAHVE